MKNAIVYCIFDNGKNGEYYKKSFIFSVTSLISKLKSKCADIYCLTNMEMDFNIYGIIHYIELGTYMKMLPSIYSGYYLKLLIPLIQEFKKYDKVLFLDADTEICSDIGSIFLCDFYNNGDILAVNETSIWGGANISLYNDAIKYCKANNINMASNNVKHEYFNSGVILFNQKKLTTSYTQQHHAQILKLEAALNYAWDRDQKLFNYFFTLDHYLSREYNIFYNAVIDGIYDYGKFRDKANCTIIHYTVSGRADDIVKHIYSAKLKEINI